MEDPSESLRWSDPRKLLDEIRAAEDARDLALKSMREQVAQYHTPAYTGKGGEYLPENHPFEFVSLTIPQLAYRNPRVRLATGRDQFAEEVKAYQHAANQWMGDVEFWRTQERTATDFCFAWGVQAVSSGPRPGFEEWEDPPHLPQVARVSPRRWAFDPLALSYEEARYAFHIVVELQSDLIERAKADRKKPKEEREGWNLELIKSLGADDGLDLARHKEGPKRGELVYYEVWVPGERTGDKGPDEGFHGTIYTLPWCGTDYSDEAKPDFLRDPRPFFGPRWGPYVLYGSYVVPDEGLPLSALVACRGQVAELNRVAISMSASIENYKRMVLVDAADKKLIQAVKDGQHDYVYGHTGLKKDSVVPLEIGGITDQMLASRQLLRDQLDRNSGITDAKRGKVTGDATATENAIADAAADVRQGHLKNKFIEGTRRALRSVLWYLHRDGRIVMELGSEAAGQEGAGGVFVGGGAEDFRPELVGKMFPGMEVPGPESMPEEQVPFDALELRIDVGSMGYKGPEAQRADAQLYIATLQALGQIGVSFPFIDLEGVASDIGESMGFPDLAKRINAGQAQALAALMLQSDLGPEDAEQPQARLVPSGGGGKVPTVQAAQPKQIKPENSVGRKKPAMEPAGVGA